MSDDCDHNKECCGCQLPEESIAIALMGPLKDLVLELADYYGVDCGEIVAAGIAMVKHVKENRVTGIFDEDKIKKENIDEN